MLYYLPGCDVNNNHPLAGEKIQNYMKKQGAAEAQCCRLDVGYFSDGDVIIQNCTQCNLILKERCPDIKVISLYEYILSDSDFKWVDFEWKTITVQDCFRTRNDKNLQAAVRSCLRKMSIEFIEAEENRENSNYCGVWLNNPADPVSEAVAPKTFSELEKYRRLLSEEEQKQKMKAQVKKYKTAEVVVYCNGCEKGMLIGGGMPIHMMELLAAGL